MLQHSTSSLRQSHSKVALPESDVLQPSIENMSGKTPARLVANNPQRRAFGDISNRKGLRPHASTHKVVSDPTIDLETVVKPKFDSTAFKDQNAVSKTKVLPELRRVGKVQFIFPDSVDRSDRPSKSSFRPDNQTQFCSEASTSSGIPLDEVEIERPAGQLYDDQLSFDWDDDPTASLIDGAMTYRQEWIDTLEELHEYKLQMKEQTIEESIRNLEKLALQDIDGESAKDPFVIENSCGSSDRLLFHLPNPSVWGDEHACYETDSCSLSIDFPPSP